MKLLFDQNISHRIIRQIPEIYSESTHVTSIGLTNSSDIEIFNFAKKSGFAVVTFDSDFVDLNILHGSPPKIIWIKTGNLTTIAILNLLTINMNVIKEFISTDTSGILEIIG